MKNLPNVKFLIFLFLLLNICVFSVIFLLYSLTSELKIAQISEINQSYSFPSLAKEISEKINVGSKAFIIYDPATRAVLLGKNEKLRFTPASTVKIMTATIVLEHYDLNRILTAKNIDLFEGSTMKLVEGEQITVRSLLYGMMLPSGNDAARVLAQNFLPEGRQGPGGEAAFVAAMNKKTQDLQMVNTRFVDPDGYDDANYTTAYDLARLAAYAMENSTFSKIVATEEIIVTDISGEIIHDLKNLNELLGSNNITGIKTGFTDEAGGVLVTSIEKDNRRYIVVVLNSQNRFSDTKSVVEETLQKIRLLFY